MAPKIYRDQVERFYDLEEREYSRSDIASLCCISASQLSIWRRTPPHPEDYGERPDTALGLPPMREKKALPRGGNVPAWLAKQNASGRVKRPPPREPAPPAGDQDNADPPDAPSESPDPRGSNPSAPAQKPAHVQPKMLRPNPPRQTTPGLTLPERHPPNGKAGSKAAASAAPVTRVQLDRAVDKALKAQRAELLKEIKAQGFDPAVTWTTEVNHEAFDPVRALVQLAHVPGCPEHTILGVLRELVRLRKERAKIAWDAVVLADIPQEYRARLFGMLAEDAELDELPLEVQEHGALREVFELTGVALPKPAEAEAFLLRWEDQLEAMRADAEARTVAERASGQLTMDGPPKVAAEFKVRPSTGTRPP